MSRNVTHLNHYHYSVSQNFSDWQKHFSAVNLKLLDPYGHYSIEWRDSGKSKDN